MFKQISLKLRAARWKARTRYNRIKRRLQHFSKCHLAKPAPLLVRIWVGDNNDRRELGRILIPYAPLGHWENLEKILYYCFLDKETREQAEPLPYSEIVGYEWQSCEPKQCAEENKDYRYPEEMCQECDCVLMSHIYAEEMPDHPDQREFKLITGENQFWDFTGKHAQRALIKDIKRQAKITTPLSGLWENVLALAASPDWHRLAETLRRARRLKEMSQQ